jgi:hypothetical protein
VNGVVKRKPQEHRARERAHEREEGGWEGGRSREREREKERARERERASEAFEAAHEAREMKTFSVELHEVKNRTDPCGLTETTNFTISSWK